GGGGCEGRPGRPAEADRPLRRAQVVDLATLYNENGAGCHGADGKLGAARPLNDPIYLTAAGVGRLRDVTAAGVDGSLMPGFAVAAGGMLTAEQIDIVVNGMRAHWC